MDCSSQLWDVSNIHSPFHLYLSFSSSLIIQGRPYYAVFLTVGCNHETKFWWMQCEWRWYLPLPSLLFKLLSMKCLGTFPGPCCCKKVRRGKPPGSERWRHLLKMWRHPDQDLLFLSCYLREKWPSNEFVPLFPSHPGIFFIDSQSEPSLIQN